MVSQSIVLQISITFTSGPIVGPAQYILLNLFIPFSRSGTIRNLYASIYYSSLAISGPGAPGPINARIGTAYINGGAPPFNPVFNFTISSSAVPVYISGSDLINTLAVTPSDLMAMYFSIDVTAGTKLTFGALTISGTVDLT